MSTPPSCLTKKRKVSHNSLTKSQCLDQDRLLVQTQAWNTWIIKLAVHNGNKMKHAHVPGNILLSISSYSFWRFILYTTPTYTKVTKLSLPLDLKMFMKINAHMAYILVYTRNVWRCANDGIGKCSFIKTLLKDYLDMYQNYFNRKLNWNL